MQMSACSQLLWQRPWAQPSPVRQICTLEYSKVLFQPQYGFLPADIAFVPKVNSSTILFFFSLSFLLSLFLSAKAISGKTSHITCIGIWKTQLNMNSRLFFIWCSVPFLAEIFSTGSSMGGEGISECTSFGMFTFKSLPFFHCRASWAVCLAIEVLL